MAGEPLGARQTHAIALQYRNYESIAGIEFIEQEARMDNIRSAAYRPTESGGQTRIRTGVQDDLVDSDLSELQARAYIQEIVDAGIFGWNYSYRPAQGSFVNVFAQWRLKIEFKPETGCKPFIAEGENHFPDNYDAVVDALLRQTHMPA